MPFPIPEPALDRTRAIFNNARTESGLTIDALTERSGLSRMTLLNLAAGRVRGDLRTWVKLAKAFETPLDELLAPIWDE